MNDLRDEAGCPTRRRRRRWTPACITVITAAALVPALAGWPAPRVTAAPTIKPLTPGTSWNWQISSTPTDADIAIVGNLANPKKMLDIDGEGATPAIISKIKASGIVAICYMETGAIEDYRSDYASFPPSTWGKQVPGYPDEHYLDIRQQGVVNAMKARVDSMAAKGCDGIEPDIDDSFLEGQSTTGLPLTESIQVSYDTTLINYAHSLGMSMGLKNGADQQFVSDMAVIADWALNEECNQYQECGPYSTFTSRNKAVFQVEYSTAVTSFCPPDNSADFDGLKKSTSLNATPRTACRLETGGPPPTTTTAPAGTTTTTSAPPPTTTTTTTTPGGSNPSPPTNVRATVRGSTVTLAWKRSISANGVDYIVTDVGGADVVSDVTNNRAVLKKQQRGTHRYQVQAIDRDGNHSVSTPVLQVTV